MTRHSAIDDQSGDLVMGGDAFAHEAQDKPALLRLALRADLMRGATEQARASADLLARLEGHASGLGLLIEAALDLGRAQAARVALAQAEGSGELSMSEAALLRARIAQALGDLDAARAILVAAIETVPDQIAPRRALAEVMVAMGTAADARAVLAHLGSGAEKATTD